MNDFTISFVPGDPAALIFPRTWAGRTWLCDHAKGQRINNSALVRPRQLLRLIKAMDRAGLRANWKEAGE